MTNNNLKRKQLGVKKREHKLIAKMIKITFFSMLPMFIIITILFINAASELKKKTSQTIEYNIKEITGNIDDTILHIYNVSDAFANEPRLLEYLNDDNTQDDRIRKQKAITYIIRTLFDGYNLLQQNEQIGAILVNRKNLFNFKDVNCDNQEIIDKLLGMGIDDKEKLSKFFWYPLQDNFLTEREYENIRKNKVIIGSRRVYSKLRGNYPYVHLFVLPEESIYVNYENAVDIINGEVFIVDADWNLISASDKTILQEEKVDPILSEQLRGIAASGEEVSYHGEVYYTYMTESEVTGWKTIGMIPGESTITLVYSVYRKVLWVALICILVFFGILYYLYKSFMGPIARLNEAMKEVYEGNLNAYIDVKDYNEAGRMNAYFNSMLESINHNVKEKLEAEKEKKDLEMEVLMSQVNPHFLYNTLENIVWKAHAAGSPEIGRLAASLGHFYRLSINDGEVIIRFPQEIEQVMSYIRIQQQRYGEKFQFELRMDSAKISSFYTLKLILQPVVENSFVYGMDGLDTPLKIRMTVTVREESIRIRIADNGVGISRDRLKEVRSQIKQEKNIGLAEKKRAGKGGTGIGLQSVYARMAAYFGIYDAIHIYSRKGEGTLTVIDIPLRKQP